jgi:hypothetical protein
MKKNTDKTRENKTYEEIKEDIKRAYICLGNNRGGE